MQIMKKIIVIITAFLIVISIVSSGCHKPKYCRQMKYYKRDKKNGIAN
jgi:uncharacterized protein YxeA